MTEYTDAEMHFRRARAMEPYLCMHMDIYSLVLFQLHREVALSALAQDLLDVLGLNVSIAYKGDGAGEVVLRYASLEQLDDICRRLMGS